MDGHTISKLRGLQYDPRLGLFDCFARVRDIIPDEAALVSGCRRLSYRQTSQAAEAIARRLVVAGVTPGDRVAIVANRSIETVLAMLGTLRAGASYVPLDPSYASEQLDYIIGDVAPAAILWADPFHDLAERLARPGIAVLGIRESQEAVPFRRSELPKSKGADLAYVMYTSGSTGRPKGVIVQQHAVGRLGFDQPVGELLPGDVMLHSSTIAADGSVLEIWGPLITGGTVAIVAEPKPALDKLAEAIRRHKPTTALMYSGVFHLMVEHQLDALSGLRMIFAGGDVLSPPLIARAIDTYPDLKLCNIYGPAENAVYSTMHHITRDDLNGDPIPIGLPEPHSDCFVLDDDMNEQGDNETGQLALSGMGVALGYLNLPEQTAERFIDDPRPGRSGRVYLTGDMVRRRPDGIYEFFGRLDRQVKIGGRRIELDEIEHVMRGLPMLADAAVAVIHTPQGDSRIAAFLKPADGLPEDERAFLRKMQEEMKKSLPEGMWPRAFFIRPEFPLTENNKVDRKALVRMAEEKAAPRASAQAPETTAAESPAAKPAPKADKKAVMQLIASVWDEILSCGPVAPDMTFFEAGGTSLQLIDAHAALEERLGKKFGITLLFETPRLQDLAEKLAEIADLPAAEASAAPEPAARSAGPDLAEGAIAIVGMAGRFPGSSSVADFWDHIRKADNLIPHFAPEELEDSFTAEERAASNYVPARPVLPDADMFDAKFFKMYPREAAVADPQGRVFLEICYEALEDAGHDPYRTPGTVGVFAGSSMSTYMLNNVLGDRAKTEDFTSNYQVGNYAELTGNVTDSLATRVAYKLNLKGPAYTLHTACSTSLTAISQAVMNLRSGQCDMALAGGVSITFPQKRGYFCLEGGMVSPDGVCRPFDADAGGTVFGHGAGVVVLRRLEDAVADGDQIYAVIHGVGVNNDGSDKIAYTAPSVNRQADAIRAAQRDAGVTPDTISYVECHGTATPLGDPIELRALAQAFGGAGGPESCAIGSVKGNVGHLDAAAGVVSVIKTALMLKHREIPAVANFRRLNPKIDLTDAPFRVPSATAHWDSEGPRRAGVSSFGVGGTNVHLVLEEAPDLPIPESGAELHILPLSAKSPEALTEMHARLADALEAEGAPALADAAFTLQEGRPEYEFRSAIAAREVAEAAAELRKAPPVRRPVPADTPAVAFMFPGQGSQYPGMGSGLYQHEPEFARWIDEGAEILEPILGLDINKLLCFGDTSDKDAARALRDTRLTQPALFLIQFACAKLWEARGVRPAAMIGHSVGEFAAATLAGVMDFETGLKIIAARGQLMQDQPGGAMLSVRAPLEEIEPHLDGTVDIAARNAPKLNVLAGSHEAIDAMAAKLEAAGVPSSKLHTSHAFHSRMMDPVCEALSREIAGIRLNPRQIPYVSCVTGDWISEAEATDPAYWAAQARKAVNFAEAVAKLAEDRNTVFVECGAGGVLSAFTSQTLPRDGHAGIIQALPDHNRQVPDELAMATAFGRLWAAGPPVDWSRSGPRGSQRVSLPTYPFQRKRHWVDAPASAAVASVSQPVPAQTAVSAVSLEQGSVPVKDDTARPAADRKARLTEELLALLSDLSGEDLGPDDAEATFLELGFDSLFLGQVTQRISADYGAELTFRQLLSDYPSTDVLAAYLDETLPPEVASPAAPLPAPAPAAAPVPAAVPILGQPAPVAAPAALPAQPAGSMAELLQAQMQTMQAVFAQQIAALGGAAAPADPVAKSAPAKAPDGEEAEAKPAKPVFSIGRATNAAGGDLTPEQLAFAQDLARRYSARNPGSKAYAQKYRATLADPRTAAGFRAEWKELVFPVVADRSKGARIWDTDGNEYIDLVNGFGQTAFGHSPDFVIEAVSRQMERGFAIGPQSDLAGPVAERFAKMVGHERVTFCNTGSEAVMAAMRLARAVTGREQIVVFSNDYHGQFDEVLVKGKLRGAGDPAALPIAPGIPRSGLANMKVLPYGAEESLDWIRANARDIAAVVVEPVQSRHPELRPRDFVRALRDITAEFGTALVMDEVVTGFRVGPRGMQGEWDIQADMATYGKVVGGGMPIGMLAGSRRFMDALDGGMWSFGDASVPEAAPTFFAGTFVRHPLVLAALDATLDHIEKHGPDLWGRVAERTQKLVEEMNIMLAQRGLPRLVEGYSSWFVLNLADHDPNAALIFPLMRLKGVHVAVGYLCIFTTQHSEEDFQRVAQVFEEAVDELRSVGILSSESAGQAAVPAQQPTTKAESPAPAPTPAKAIPLTEAQREIWMTSQLSDQASCSFNESSSMRLSGDLDQDALQRALNRVIARHDGLRQKFARNGESFDILDPFSLDMDFHDLSGEDDPEAAFRELLAEDSATPIDLVAGPPLRAMLLRKAPQEHVLVINAHHIVCDGWSYNVLFGDLAALYTEETGGAKADLPPAPSFAAYAVEMAGKPVRAEVTEFWRKQYADVPELPELPTDRPRAEVKSYTGATCTAHIDGEIMRAARKAGAKQGCTLFSTLFAALQIVMGRLSGSGDVVLGVPTGGQALLENSALVGHCVNFLPIRAGIDPKGTVAQHLKHVSAQVMNAFDHQDYTYGTLVRELGVERSLNRLPLTEIQFNLEKLAENLGMGGLEATVAPNPKTAVNFDLFFNVVERRDGLRVDVDYNADLYDADTVARWIGHLETVLSEIAADAERPVSALPILTGGQVGFLAETLNSTAADYPREALVHELVARMAQQHPDSVAAEDGTGTATYAELARRSDAIAAGLQSLLPAPNHRVAVAMHRSIDCLAAMLGVMKAGHAYVPLDPSQPEARLRSVLQASRAGAAIHDAASRPGFAEVEGLKVLSISEIPEGGAPHPVDRGADPTAYVIFTSGSTGTPKGVEIGHRSVVNLLNSMSREPGFTDQDVMLAVTTTSFDISVLELFLPLIRGGKVVIASKDDVLDGFRLVARLDRGDITQLQATPTLWTMLLEAGLKPGAGLKMLCGGEPLPADLAQKLTAGGGEVWNLYGPTESTIWSAVSRMNPGDRVTIGHPIANTELHVLGPSDELMPIGAVGELNIGGDGLAKGYFDRDDLTAQAFRDVGVNGKARRLYRTGDLARRLPDGTLQVLGRRDGQIKLRGFRIELGEVEAALRSIDGVKAAAAALRPSPRGGDQLVGYVVRDRAQAGETELGAALADLLPAYMIPTAWATLSELPQTANGKLDRKALPAPEASATVTALHTQANTETERKLAAIWEEVLGIENISTSETLYALGADSLTVFRIAARMIDAGLNLEARDLLQHPSIAKLAAYADSGGAESAPAKPSLRSYRGGARRGLPGNA